MGKLVPGMEKADLCARWVYAVETEDDNGVPPESLDRAAALLSVGGEIQPRCAGLSPRRTEMPRPVATRPFWMQRGRYCHVERRLFADSPIIHVVKARSRHNAKESK